jgi:sugar phosphate isomerase/epimerase
MHVHVSDKDRTAPGTSGRDDYKPIFSILKKSGYDGPISVEAVDFDVAANGKHVLEFLKEQWSKS